MFPIFLRIAVAATVALPFAAQAANDFCVTSDAQLAQALLNAENLPARIKVVQGSYHLDATKWHLQDVYFDPEDSRIADGSSVLGGYLNNDCSSRDIAAGNTIFTDNSAVAGTGTVFLGNLLIEGITFRLKQGLSLKNDIYPDEVFKPNPHPQVTIRRSVFEDTVGAVALYVDTYESTVILENLLIKGNPTDGSNCTAFVFDSNGSDTVEAINNTLVDNNEQGLCIANRGANSHAHVYVYNNILYDNNGTDDLYTDSDNAIIVDNIIGHRGSGASLNTPPAGTINADPQLTASYRPTEPTSPAINSGSNAVPGGLPASDLDGGPRVIGSAVDRGAYESLTDDSTTLTVTTTADSGAGSLRQAIINANNSSGANSVHFDIGSDCGSPHVITLASELPLITSNLSIKGFTQPGASANDLDIGNDATICVVLKAGSDSVSHALHVGASSTAVLNVSGLAFSGFAGSAIYLNGGSAHTVAGVHMGGTVGGVGLDPVGRGIDIGPGVSGVTVGGSDDSARNIIGQSATSGVYIAGPSPPLLAAHDNQVVNNYIGVGWNLSGGSFNNRGNATVGVYVAGDHNTVSSNEIDANGSDGVRLDSSTATNNFVILNDIGTIFPNLGNGLAIENSASSNAALINTITQNAGAGIRISSGQDNLLSFNTIYANSNLGIDLAAAGVTPNDDDSATQPVDYANRGLNFPVIGSAIGGHRSGYVAGTLTTTPGTYNVQVYGNGACDPSGYGQGGNYAGGAQVTIVADAGSGQGTASFVAPVDITFSLTGQTVFSALAIDGAGNTSEFSACQSYLDDTLFADGFD